ncbi:MAG: SDR family oxidoreductase [Staphylococcus sp.]|nr:SDR family oxidoreductase [Staphylococcus sp.]
MNIAEKLFDFRGKVIIITGAAGAIGSEAARQCASLGANVVLTDINEPKVKAIAEDISKVTGTDCIGIKADATKESDLKALVDTVVSKFGKISGLINNVGWGKATPLWGSDTDKMVKSYELNTVSAYNMTKFCMPYLRKEPNASVVFSGSMVGDTPSPEFIEYSTAKAGLINMAHSMAVVSGPEVRFNVVVIGSVDNGDATLEAGYDPAMLKKISDAIVMKRRGTPSDIAHAFIFLLSEAASWITGINLMVDGGGMYESKMPG